MSNNEASVQQKIRLAAAGQNVMLWRNNNGACYDETGQRLIRYGLGNDSAKVNAVLKSSDLIGITPVTITPEMVGQTIGVFTAIEVKHTNWNPDHKPNNRQIAQAEFLRVVRHYGGKAGFANSAGMFLEIVV